MDQELTTILKIIEQYLNDNTGMRFGQALFNLNINEFADPNNPETKGHLLRDIYNDEDSDILERMGEQK